MSTLKHPCRYRVVIGKIRDLLWKDAAGRLDPACTVDPPSLTGQVEELLVSMGIKPKERSKWRPLRETSCQPKVLVRVVGGRIYVDHEPGAEVVVVNYDAHEKEVPAAFKHLESRRTM